MATLFSPEQKPSQSFSYLKTPLIKPPINQPDSFGLLVTGWAGFHCILILSCSRCQIMHERSNFWCHFLIDGLPTNQIALLFPVCGRTEFGKIFGFDCRQFLFSTPPPPSHSHPPQFSPFVAHPRCTLLHSPACSMSLPGKGNSGKNFNFRTKKVSETFAWNLLEMQ